MMDRRRFLLTSLAGVLAASPAAGAPQAAKVYRLGWVAAAPPPPGISSKFPFLVQRLHELGYVEGQNLVIEQRFGGISRERYPALITELVAHKLDVTVVLGNAIARVATREAPQTPIVMVGGVDPVRDGLVPNLGRPGGSVTGLLQDVGKDVMVKQLEMLKEAVPHASRIAVIVGEQQPYRENFEAVNSAQATLGVNLQRVGI